MNILAKSTLLLFLAAILSSCATSSIHLAGQGNILSPIEMESYRIKLEDESAWKDWASSKNMENDALVFEYLNQWPLSGEVLGSATITVWKDTLSPDAWKLSEKNIADNLRNMEEKEMREKGWGDGKRKVELTEVTKETIQHNGKRLYVMKYKAQSGSNVGAYLKQIPVIDAALYIYFPENFRKDHTVYRFLIVDSYKLGRPTAKTGLHHIFPVIDGFELKMNES